MLERSRPGFGRGIAVIASLAFVLPLLAAQAPPPGSRGSQPKMLDARVNLADSYRRASAARPGAADAGLERTRQTTAAIVTAIDAKKRSMPGLQVRLSGMTGAPETVRNSRGALTSPSVQRNESIVRGFLSQNGGLYGLSAADLADLVVVGDSAGGRSGLRMLRMEQRIDGRPVFQSETRFVLDRSGRLIGSNGRFVPNARAATPRVESTLTPAQAITKLLGAEGRSADSASFSVTPANGAWIQISENDEYVAGTAYAREMLFPLGPGQLVPAWALIVFTAGDNDWYAIVDSETGDLLWRKNIRHSVSAHDARFRVFVQADGRTPADSPAPGSPNALTPGSNTQFPFLPPTIVSMHAVMNPTASQNGWINDCSGACTANETQTLGNNVLACLDRTNTKTTTNDDINVCDTDANSVLDGNGRPTGNTDSNGRDRDFLGTTTRDFQTTFTPPPQTTAAQPEVGQTATGTGVALNTFRRGAVTQLFYISNWYHDELYTLGFDEDSANFQQVNFTGMGLGGDRVLADAQDGSGTNNANFSTPPDGVSGRMQMYRFTGPTIDRDGDLDAEIVVHELTHGTSNRLVGNSAGLNWEPASAMGEGWSDFFALSMLNNTNADDPNGQYPMGGYATYKLGNSAFQDNYIYGIRRFPYSTNNSINPTTWADVDDVTNNLSGGIAPDPRGINILGGMQVHNAGTVWALTLWEVRARIIADPAGANGDVPTGNTTALQLVTDGLKLTPIDPTFTEARDAILDADCATNTCANEASIWGGFADRGLGYNAAAPYRLIYNPNLAGHQAIHESFNVPYLDVVNVDTDVDIDDSPSNNNGAIDPGEAFYLNVTLTNPWRAASKAVTAGAVATLTSSTPGVTIWDNTATYPAIAPQSSAAASDTFTITLAPSALAGQSLDFTLSINSSLGVTSTQFKLRVGARNGTDPVVTYTKNTQPDLAIPEEPNGKGVVDSMSITDDFEIADIDFRVDSATHPFVGDLTFMLRSPQGTGVDLISVIDGLNDFGGEDIVNMVIDDDLAVEEENDMILATDADAPYTRSWLPVFNGIWMELVFGLPTDPVGNLSRMDRQSTNGTWSVNVSDQYEIDDEDQGTLNAWSILVTPTHFDVTAFAPAVLDAATKTVSGTFEVGGAITYTITLTNNGTAAQADNTGDEFTDTLPASLTLVSASATSGTASTAGNTVTWNGTLAPLGGSVTITINATINSGTQGTTISNQGTVNYDGDGNNTNESSQLTDDPSVGGSADPTSFLVANVLLTGTKAVVDASPYSAGDNVVYTITLFNGGSAASPDNPGDELTDVLPSQLTLVSASASSGTAVANVGTNTVTWNGSVPPGGGSVTITINATINAGTQGATISNQASYSWDADLDGTNESTSMTDDPTTQPNGDATTIAVGAALDTLTKTVSGTFEPGNVVTYTIVITNTGDSDSPDNAGNELTDVLPSTLTLTGATASSGTAVATLGTNTVTWNGTVPSGGSVTITINALIEGVPDGTSISNQATLLYDADGNGSNETTAVSDDPGTGAANDPTTFIVTAAADVAAIPTVSELGLLLLAAGLAMLAAWKITRG